MTYSEFREQFSGVNEFMWAYGQLTYEEAKAMIDADKGSPGIKACMMTTWYKARRRYRLHGVPVCLRDDGSLSIMFLEMDSEFDGNDFEYTYSLDPDNTSLFLNKLPNRWTDKKTEIEEWLIENIDCEGFGYDLLDKWIRMGLHGKQTVYEDYPGGIFREESF